MKNYLGVSFEPLVSIDYKQCTYSGVVDALSTRVVGDKLVKVLTWYDNEWGYSQRVLDLAALLLPKDCKISLEVLIGLSKLTIKDIPVEERGFLFELISMFLSLMKAKCLTIPEYGQPFLQLTIFWRKAAGLSWHHISDAPRAAWWKSCGWIR